MSTPYPDIEGQLYTSGVVDAAYAEAEARQRAADRREVEAAASAAGASALVSAKTYTDSKVTGLATTAAMNAADALTLSNAKTHTDAYVRSTAESARRAADDAARAESAAARAADDLAGFDPRFTALEAAAGFGPATPEDGTTAAFLADPKSMTREALTSAVASVDAARAGLVSVMDHGATADGATDDANALRAAAAAVLDGQAKNLGSRTLLVPADRTLYINSVVDLRYIVDLRLEGRVIVGPDGCLVVGHSSAQRPGQRIYIRDARNAGSGTNTTVRCVGMKQAQVYLNRVSRVELLADSMVDANADGSLAYNTFHLGRIESLTLLGKGADGWITQNLFVGGDLKAITVTGEYGHNENLWLKPCVEAGTIVFDCGHRNRFIDARCEGGTTIRFSARTARNTIEDSFVSNPNTLESGVQVVEDLGLDNIVTSVPAMHQEITEVAALDAATAATDGACEVRGAGVVPGLGMVAPRKAWDYLLDTGLFLVAQDDMDAKQSRRAQAWAVKRFLLSSDTECFRPVVELFDKDGSPVSNALAGSWSQTAPGRHTMGADVSVANILITDPKVTHARIRARAGATSVPFAWLRLTAYGPRGQVPAGRELVRRQARQGLYQTAKPSQGAPPVGTTVQGPSASWVVSHHGTARILSASGATLTLSESPGTTAGDVVGVLLATGATHWTTAASASEAQVTLTDALPSAVAANGLFASARWITRG